MATDTHLLAIGATFHLLHDLDTLPQRQTEFDVRVRHDEGRDEENGDDQVEVERLTPVDPVGARRRAFQAIVNALQTKHVVLKTITTNER